MAHTGTSPTVLTARRAGLVGCTHCGKVHNPEVALCTRCGARLESRDAASMQKVWAWLVAGLVFFIPANLYPMLRTTLLGKTTESTILGGVVDLTHHGSWGIALIVFVASLCIPVAMPEDLCAIDDELKAIYHGPDSVCVWVFETREDRNRFVEETAGMKKAEREAVFETLFRGRS